MLDFIKKNQVRVLWLPLLIGMAWYWMASYTFNTKPDLNGDNIYYYVTASAMATGHGYSDLSKLGAPATATYPPGYPLLMTPLRMVTDSVVAQKWMNEVFVLLSLWLIYVLLLHAGLPIGIAFVAALAGAFIPRVLHFSTMMMSESAFMLTGVLVLYCLQKMFATIEEKGNIWYTELKSPWLYLMILCILINYHVRTQGLALMAAVCFCLLLQKRWASLGTTIVGFALGYLPWTLRNKALGLSNTRYLDMVMVANPWRPEEGTISISEFVVRFFDTVRMLLFAAIPNTTIPFASINPDEPVYTAGYYLLGIVMIGLMCVGAWQLGKIRWAVIGYFAATVGIISVFSTPSGSRYLTSIMPLLTMAELVGLWFVVVAIWKKITHQTEIKPTYQTVAALVLLPLLLLGKSGLEQEHQMSRQKYPLPYTQFFQMGKELKKAVPENTVICSRKSQLLWMYANRPGCGYLYTQDDKELLRDLIEKKVDYVILDALGYSSTGLYLWPAVQKNAQYFPIVMQYDNTHQYLLRFLREKAAEDMTNSLLD